MLAGEMGRLQDLYNNQFQERVKADQEQKEQLQEQIQNLQIAIFHCPIQIIAERRPFGCRCRRLPERRRLTNEWDGKTHDYTHKPGIVHKEIMLPAHAPPEFQDRSTLWNAVENAERGKKAQLAYSFDIALQNEFSLEENIALARQFVSEQLVGRGMIADFSIHQPDKEDGGIPNPHFHVLCPIRPIEESGKWGL